ncbi:nucleoporin nup211-like [Miscanthus floridulus]|uniref:nucleoporin nup211-like n=1 Tax=Miscanthus floridulus TaxID=154761 RepID=UPI003457EF4C
MARDGGGALAPAPAPGQVYLPAWRRAYDRLVKMLRQAYRQAEELSVEREHLITEIEFLQSSRHEREEISQARIQRIYKDQEFRKRVADAETAVGLGGKELQIRCYQKLAELAEDDLEDFKSCISNLAAENTELKEKLKKLESQVEISTENSDHQKSGKDVREEIRKLKKAYKVLRSEKDKEILELQAENKFVWNQLKTMEEDYSGTMKSKNVEVKQATEAAQKKDDEIVRLQVEVTNAKERMSILEYELQKLRSLVKGKDLETDKNEDGQPEASRMSKKDTNKANRKSKSTRTSQVTPDISRTSQVTPDRREVKTTTRMRASETNQKRKRSSFKSSLSCGNQRCYTRPLKVKAGVSPMLLPPNFTVPRLKTPTHP